MWIELCKSMILVFDANAQCWKFQTMFLFNAQIFGAIMSILETLWQQKNDRKTIKIMICITMSVVKRCSGEDLC